MGCIGSSTHKAIIMKGKNMCIINIFRNGNKAKKVFRILPICMAICIFSTLTTFADWFKTADNVWRYTYSNGTLASAGLHQINGASYMFDATGNMLTGWQQNANGWMYFDLMSGAMSKGWKNIDGKYYCFNDQLGLLYTNCKTPDGYTVDNNGVWVETACNTVSTTSTTQSIQTVKAAYNENGRYIYEEDDMVYEYKVYNNGEEVDEEDIDNLSDKQLYKLITGSYKRSSDPSKNCSKDETLEKIVEYVNILRTKKGCDKLEMDDSLMEAASIRAEELSEEFSHTRPDGTKCFTVLDEMDYEAGYKGENIAKGQTTALNVTNLWFHSSGHRKNMMNKNYNKIGVGMYEDKGGKHWVQLFSD